MKPVVVSSNRLDVFFSMLVHMAYGGLTRILQIYHGQRVSWVNISSPQGMACHGYGTLARPFSREMLILSE